MEDIYFKHKTFRKNDIIPFLDVYEFTLLSDINLYKNGFSKVSIICKNNHKFDFPFNYIKNKIIKNNKCHLCIKEQTLINQIIYKENYFNKFGYILLNNHKDYKNNKSKLDIICPNKHKIKMSWNSFQRGSRCLPCSLEKASIRMKKDNNPNWNPNRQDLSLNRRLRITRRKSWIKKYLINDPLYYEFTQNPSLYHLDHKIPINAFIHLLNEYNLNEDEVRRMANDIKNLEIKLIKENFTKSDYYNQEELLIYYKNNYFKYKGYYNYG